MVGFALSSLGPSLHDTKRTTSTNPSLPPPALFFPHTPSWRAGCGKQEKGTIGENAGKQGWLAGPWPFLFLRSPCCNAM